MKPKIAGVLMFGMASMLVIWMMTGCEGGGTMTAVDGGTGKVALTLTDGPAESFDHIWIEISRVSLLSENGQVVLFNPAEPVRYDLLNLRPEDENDLGALLAVQEVAVGMYDKIRLEIAGNNVSGVPYEYVVVGEQILPGGEPELTYFKLPSGKIDLNPRAPFEIALDRTLAITLDIDCDKSIHISGNAKNFRPVVFVDIQTVDRVPLCPRVLQGTLTGLRYAADDETVIGFELTLAGGVRLPITMDEATVVMNNDGDVIDPQALAVGNTLTVRGGLQPEGLMAQMVVIGAVERLAGAVSQPVDANGQFVLDIDADPEDSAIAVTDKTLILLGCNGELPSEAIQPGMRAVVFGIRQPDDSVKAVAVLLHPRKMEGELTRIEADGADYILTVDFEGISENVYLPANAPIGIKFDGALSAAQLIGLVEECKARSVEIILDPAAESDLTAARVTLLPEGPLPATLIEVDAANRLLAADKGIIRVKEGARIVDLTEQNNLNRLAAELTDLKSGDQLVLYGLSLCTPAPGSPVFEAAVILVESRK